MDLKLNENINNLDEIMLDEDMQKLLGYWKARNNIINIIGMEKLIDAIKKSIKDSEIFSFRSENAESFIDINNPIFIIKYNDKPDYNNTISDKELVNYMDTTTDKVYKEIIEPTGKLFNAFFEEHEEDLNKVLNIEERELFTSLFSNMFGILTSSPNENNIQIRLII